MAQLVAWLIPVITGISNRLSVRVGPSSNFLSFYRIFIFFPCSHYNDYRITLLYLAFLKIPKQVFLSLRQFGSNIFPTPESLTSLRSSKLVISFMKGTFKTEIDVAGSDILEAQALPSV